MESEKIVKCTIDNNLINHVFFAYLDADNRKDIIQRLEEKRSIVGGFHYADENTDMLFCVVFDFEQHIATLHVREVAGYFARVHDYLDVFTQGFAKYLGCDTITFNTEHRAIKRFAERQGFAFSSDIKEFRKVIH